MLGRYAARHNAATVRVDSGGRLNGALLRAGLVDEVSVLVGPALVGGASPRSMFQVPDPQSADDVIDLELVAAEAIRDGYVWLRYVVAKKSSQAGEADNSEKQGRHQ